MPVTTIIGRNETQEERDMPGNVAPVANEREGLMAYLAQQRLVLRTTAYGLTDEQARQAPTVSSLSVGGLIKHVSAVERNWMDIVLQRPSEGGGEESYENGFRLVPGETLQQTLDDYEETARQTAEIIDGIADLDQPVPVPKGVPWFPQDVDAWSVRWVLLHLIQETARHAGHADIVREGVDGATGFALLAAAEGWPATPWLTPWSRQRQLT
jgi:uncharacterized damage-inducible protein DinB